MNMDDMGEIIRTNPQAVNTVEDALIEAERASSPSETVRWQHAALRLLLHRVNELELGVGLQEATAMENVRARARRIKEGGLEMRLGL
jgi:hypothetical protein